MKQSIRLAPPNSMFFLEDAEGGTVPQINDAREAIWATASCIIVGCLSFMDGETEFVVSDEANDARSAKPAFDGRLNTPSRLFEVSTSERSILLRVSVCDIQTRVRIWTNRAVEPDRIEVVLS